MVFLRLNMKPKVFSRNFYLGVHANLDLKTKLIFIQFQKRDSKLIVSRYLTNLFHVVMLSL